MKEWEFDENEIFDVTLGFPACCGNPVIDVPHHKHAAHKIGKAYQKKLVGWLKKHNDFNECSAGTSAGYGLLLTRSNWQELLDDLGVK